MRLGLRCTQLRKQGCRREFRRAARSREEREVPLAGEKQCANEATFTRPHVRRAALIYGDAPAAAAATGVPDPSRPGVAEVFHRGRLTAATTSSIWTRVRESGQRAVTRVMRPFCLPRSGTGSARLRRVPQKGRSSITGAGERTKGGRAGFAICPAVASRLSPGRVSFCGALMKRSKRSSPPPFAKGRIMASSATGGGHSPR